MGCWCSKSSASDDRSTPVLAAAPVPVPGAPVPAAPVPAPGADDLLKQLQDAAENQPSAPASDQLLELLNAALEQLQHKADQQGSTSGAGKAANKVLEKVEPHVNALTGLAAAFKTAVGDVKSGAYDVTWTALGSTATALLSAGTAATYIGPVFALLGYAIKQWSTCQQVPKEAIDLLTATRDMVFDLNKAWKHITEQQPILQQQQQQQEGVSQQQQEGSLHPDQQQNGPTSQQQSVLWQRLQRWTKLAAEAAAECVVVHKQRVVYRFALAHTYKASLGKQAEATKTMRIDLLTPLAQFSADKVSAVLADAILHKNEILMRLAPVFRPVPSLPGKVGRDDVVDKLRLELLSGEGVKGLLLHGMGGIGKSTVAALLVSHMQQITPSPFPGGVYMVSVQTEVQYAVDKDTLIDVQKRLLEEITRREERAPQSIDIGARWLAEGLRQASQKGAVFLVVDNVPEGDEGIRGVLPINLDRDGLAPGSRLLFTSRSAKAKGLSEVCSIQPHRVDLLSRKAAVTVLQPRGVHLTNRQLQEALDFCDGLPLALSLLNGALEEDDPIYVLERLTTHGEIGDDAKSPLWSKLSFSVEALNSELRGTWLDLAWGCLGKFWQTGFGFNERCFDVADIEKLKARNLVTSKGNTIHIHDVLLQLAKHMIGRSDSNEFRVIVNALPLPHYEGKCVGLVLRSDSRHDVHIDVAKLPPIQPMRILQLSQEANQRAPLTDLNPILSQGTNLRLLEATASTPITNNIVVHLPKLRMLEICGCTGAPNFNKLQMPSLRVLVLEDQSITFLDDSIGTLCELRVLHLRSCLSLQQLPEALGNLHALQQLRLHWCKQLSTLPESIGQLTTLQELRLHACEQLSTLPESIGQLTALQKLDLSGCEQLRTLPESIGQLTALQELHIYDCKQLSTLPEPIGQLTRLQRLDVKICKQLSTLPESIGQLTALHKLDFSSCKQLSTLPESIGQLTALQKLDLSGCKQLSIIPESIGQLTALQKLDLSGCKQLSIIPESIGQLTALQELYLIGCKQLSTLPESIGQLTALQELYLFNCKQLSTLPEPIGQLTALQRLPLNGCQQLRTIPESIGQLTALRELYLFGCKQLSTLPESIGQLTALQNMDISDCEQLSTLPESISQLTALQKMDLSRCEQLSPLPESIGQLTALQELYLFGCNQLSTLPEPIGQLKALRILRLSFCKQLSTLPKSIKQLTALEGLWIDGCKQLTSLQQLRIDLPNVRIFAFKYSLDT